MQTQPRAQSAHRPAADILKPLILDFLEWLARGPRPYADVMESLRTSCPRLTVWEDALEEGLVARRVGDGSPMVALTDEGRRRLLSAGRIASRDTTP